MNWIMKVHSASFELRLKLNFNKSNWNRKFIELNQSTIVDPFFLLCFIDWSLILINSFLNSLIHSNAFSSIQTRLHFSFSLVFILCLLKFKLLILKVLICGLLNSQFAAVIKPNLNWNSFQSNFIPGLNVFNQWIEINWLNSVAVWINGSKLNKQTVVAEWIKLHWIRHSVQFEFIQDWHQPITNNK